MTAGFDFSGRWILVKPRRLFRAAVYKCSWCEKLCSSRYNNVVEFPRCPYCGMRMKGIVK